MDHGDGVSGPLTEKWTMGTEFVGHLERMYMTVYFINPPFKWEYGKFSRESRSPAVAKSGVLYYPLWLIYAAAYAEKSGFDVRFLDAPAKRYDFEKSLEIIDNELNSKEEIEDANTKAYTKDDSCAQTAESGMNKKEVGTNPEGNTEPGCLFVVETSTPSIESDAAFCKKLKEKYPQAFVYMVGTHPTATAEETLTNYPWVDGIARREYDFTISKFAKVIETFYANNWSERSNTTKETIKDQNGVSRETRGGIVESESNGEKSVCDNAESEGNFDAALASLRGISYRSRSDGSIKHNPDAEYITDLDEIPLASDFIKRHLDYKDYFFAAAEYPEIQIFTGRGCPCRCNFCVYPQTMHGHGYRLRSPQNVVEEFKYIADNFPDVKEIVIEDDTFTINRKRVTEICDLLIETGLNKRFKWLCNARVNTLDLDTMKLMKKAGCRLVIPGIESGTQEVLDNIKKGTTIGEIREYIKNTKKAGLLVHACYMVGNQGETRETMEKTLKLALELNTDTAQFFPLIPYPGTEAYEWNKARGYIKNGYTGYCKEDGTHNCVLDLPGISGEEMVKFCNDARKKYYLRPGYILHRLVMGLKDPNDLKRSLKAFGQFRKYLFK